MAEKRIALVIGNSTYKNSPLTNPENDARLMAKTLEKVGFEVTTLIDGDLRAMKLAMVHFGRKLRASDAVGLFYYAGHGVQSRGENYLIPVDAEILDESEIDVFAVNVNDYLRTMERASSRINIVVLDACRNNPFARSFRSQSRGLARVDAPRGTYIAYATSPGQVALDGEGQNSPYTQALTKAINTPGLTIEETFKEARRAVLVRTDERQTPWETSSITGRFYFKKAAPKPQISREDVSWSLVKNSANLDLFRSHLRSYPEGKYADEARAAMAKLTSELEARRRQEEAERRAERERLAKAEADRLAKLAAAANAQAGRLAKLEAEPSASSQGDDNKLGKRDLAISIQRQLQRLGCNPGRPDGAWGRNSRAALQRFVKHGKVKLTSLEPSQDVLEKLSNRDSRVCPVICSKSQVKKGNRCVAKSCRRGEKLSRSGLCISTAKTKSPKKRKQATSNSKKAPKRKPASQILRKKQCPKGTVWNDVFRHCSRRL